MHAKVLRLMRTSRMGLDEGAAAIDDVLRYTIVFQLTDLCQAVRSTVEGLMANGYVVEALKNYWLEGKSYKGLNVTMKAPGGQRFELQFHTPESYEVKVATHADYEVLRDPDCAPAGRTAAHDRLVARNMFLEAPPGIELVEEQVPQQRPR